MPHSRDRNHITHLGRVPCYVLNMPTAARPVALGVLIATVFLLSSIKPAAAEDQDMTVYNPGDGVTAPAPVKSSIANYTSDAMKAGIEGCNKVEVIVLPDGSVGDVKLIESLDKKYGMDERAIESAKKWIFKPGTKDGKPVAVRTTIQSCFTNRNKKPKWRQFIFGSAPAGYRRSWCPSNSAARRFSLVAGSTSLRPTERPFSPSSHS
jgi:TonB family protein